MQSLPKASVLYDWVNFDCNMTFGLELSEGIHKHFTKDIHKHFTKDIYKHFTVNVHEYFFERPQKLCE